MNKSRLKQLMSSKQAQLGLRFFTYGVMVVSTIILSAFAIFYIMGYRFNQSSLVIEQGGLIQLRSNPENATIYVDGKEKSGTKTPARAYIVAGNHTVDLKLNGYKPWTRKFDLQSGQLLWLDYIRLVPENLTTSALHEFSGIAESAFSPDRRWLIINQAPDQAEFTLFDLSDEKQPKSSTTAIPASQLTLKDGKVGQFSVLEWDFGSRSVLVRHINGDVSEVIRIDRTKPNEAVNISKLFGLGLDEVHFAGGNQSVVYGLTGDVLRRLDIDSSTASATLVAGAKHFVIYGEDHLAFVADRESVVDGVAVKKQVVGIYQDGKEYLVRDFSVDVKLQIALTEYFRDQYLAINAGDNFVEVVRDPAAKAIEAPTLVKLDLGKSVQWLSFSSNGRMLATGNGNSWVTHDLEVGLSYASSLDGIDISKPLKWLDNFYLWTNSGDHVQIVEFDGQNPHNIAAAAFGTDVSLSQNGRSLFSLSRSANGAALQASRLLVEN